MAYAYSKDGELQCVLCPHQCTIADHDKGYCGVRGNEKGELTLPHYGRISAAALDPIEKKPLYHFYPGSQILSLGFYGCSFRCPFCQNYHISQKNDLQGQLVSPGEVVAMAKEHNSIGIAYTYSEPTIHFEFLMDCAAEVRNAGFKNVLVTNGYLNKKPARELLSLMDGVNIDLKAWNKRFYSDELKGELEPVLDFITIGAETTHVEVTTLIIEGKNDDPENLDRLFNFLASLNPDIPYHLSAYHPAYAYNLPSTSRLTIETLVNQAKQKLHYVYSGNIGLAMHNTHCPDCGALLVERGGFSASIKGLDNSKCTNCGTSIALLY